MNSTMLEIYDNIELLVWMGGVSIAILLTMLVILLKRDRYESADRVIGAVESHNKATRAHVVAVVDSVANDTKQAKFMLWKIARKMGIKIGEDV